MPRRRKRDVKKQPPSKAKAQEVAQERYIVTLFADIVGCSEISNHKKLKEYNEFINDFQECFKKVCNHYKKNEYEDTEHPFFKIQERGDEGCLMIFVSKRDDSLARDIDTAINIALDLKRNWLFTEDNRRRVKDDRFLPVDLGIGIHAGKVFVNKKSKDEYQPEGYAINLAKRIESASRDGKFTRILVSESAREQLYILKDESTYRFDKPFPITPRGISRKIKVFEIKHHFLATDWTDVPSEVSIIWKKLDDTKVDIAKMAYDTNPTNLWLAEEYLILQMMNGWKHAIKQKRKRDVKFLRKEYQPALEVAKRLAYSEQRDAGLLAIWGFICGERKEYKQEQERYEEGLVLDKQDGDLHWYLGYSLSAELKKNFDNRPQKDVSIEEFYKQNKKPIQTILAEYETARDLRGWNPWIAYDYACELSWWSQVDESLRKRAIELLSIACSLNATAIRAETKDEEYLKPIMNEQQVQRLLKEPQ